MLGQLPSVEIQARLFYENISWATRIAIARGVIDYEDAVIVAMRKTLINFDKNTATFRSFLAFVLKCELNTVYRVEVRRRLRFQALQENFDLVEPTTIPLSFDDELLDTAIASLSETDKLLIIKYYYENNSLKEIAQCFEKEPAQTDLCQRCCVKDKNISCPKAPENEANKTQQNRERKNGSLN